MATNGTTNGTHTNGEISKDKEQVVQNGTKPAVQFDEKKEQETKLISLDNLALIVGDIEPSQTARISVGGDVARVSTLVAERAGTMDATVLKRNNIQDDKLGKAIFEDKKWDLALEYFEGLETWNRAVAYSVLRQGAKAFGCWHLDEHDLSGLANQLMKTRASKCSSALKRWIYVNDQLLSADLEEMKHLEMTPIQSDHVLEPLVSQIDPSKPRHKLCTKLTLDEKQVQAFMKKQKAEKEKFSHIQEWRSNFESASEVKLLKWGLSFVILIISTAYAIKVCVQMYPGVISLLGWPVFFARMGGMGAACWTAVIYFTMCRGLLTRISICNVRCGRRFKLYQAFFDAHKDLHILAGKSVCIVGIEHTIAHCIGTIPGLLAAELHEINGLIGCANEDTPGNLNSRLHHFHWPDCPLEKKPRDFTEALFTTTPGLTGLLLLICVSLLGLTARKEGRTKQFERFWYVHNFILVVWPILLFIHGSNNWIGVGFPLVAFTTSFFALAYLCDRILRALRYFLFAGKSVRIMDVVIRQGKDDGPEGAMTNIQIGRPPALWHFRPGQYGFICMPEYSWFQWHPFTICSGKDDPTVDFLIAGIGDWTQELARRCLEAKHTGCPLPKVALDGPYAAPTQSALSRDVLVAVGAGVGITPFLSLMSTIIQMVEIDHENKLPLKEAHFYWSTRSCDEFLFGKSHFTHIAQSELLRRKVFLHLHVTAREKPKDPYSFIFREAVKRQSAVDRKFYKEFKGRLDSAGIQPDGIGTPTTWMNGTVQDIVWLGHLVGQYDETEESEHSQAAAEASYNGHWAQKVVKRKGTPGSGGMNSMSMSAGAAASYRPTGSASAGASYHPTCMAGFGAAGGLGSVNPTYADKTFKDPSPRDWMTPVVFGRPEFGTEVRKIGKAFPQYDVDIYICGNDAIVHQLQEVSIVCDEHARRDYEEGKSERCQEYHVHYERFG